MKCWALSVAFFMSGLFAGYSQSDTLTYNATGMRINYGFIIPHSKAIEAVSHTNPFEAEISYNWFHRAPSSLKVFNAYWISGIQAGYVDFQNPNVLGGAFTLTLFAEPVVAFHRNIYFMFRGGAGVSYHTKIYNEVTNPDNQFFCTRISFPLYVSASLKYRLTDQSFITLSCNYNHISNGGIKQPNYGMNFPTAGAGFEYYYTPLPVLKHVSEFRTETPVRRVFYIIQALTAVRVLDKTDLYPEKKTVAVGIHVRAGLPLGSIYSLNAGAELILDGYTKELISREQTGLDYKRFSVTTGQDFKFGNVYFSQYFGVYVYSPLKPVRWYYQKYELAYKFKPGIMAGVFLKAHLYEAEMMGVTVSWMIR